MSYLLHAFFYLSVATIARCDKLNNLLFSGDYEFKDLTFPFDNKTVYWPNARNFIFTKKLVSPKSTPNGYWYTSNDFAAGEHGGTHLDAPIHFAENGRMVGDISLETLIVPLIIVDVSSLVHDDPNFVLYKRHLDNLLNDSFGKPCLIVFKFGWSKFFHNRERYLGVDTVNETLNFPGLSPEVAEWIVTSYKNVVGVGVDTASVDPGSSTNFLAHQTILGAGLYMLENVDLTGHVPEYGCTAFVLPMKIAEGTGAPLRFVAVCPRQAQPPATRRLRNRNDEI